MNDLAGLGYVGMFVAAFLAATILPFSSDIVLSILLLGNYDPYYTVIIASIGNWLGGLTSYYLGYVGNWIIIEKYLRVKKEKVEKFRHKLGRFGSYLALVTWLPGIGDPLAIGLGFLRINPYAVIPLMFIGKFVRYIVVAILVIELGKLPF